MSNAQTHVANLAIACAGPAIVSVFAANAQWVAAIITAVLGSTWYARQLYKDWQESRKKDNVHPTPPPSS